MSKRQEEAFLRELEELPVPRKVPKRSVSAPTGEHAASAEWLAGELAQENRTLSEEIAALQKQVGSTKEKAEKYDKIRSAVKKQSAIHEEHEKLEDRVLVWLGLAGHKKKGRDSD